MIKAILITVLIYWIIRFIFRTWFNSLSDLGKLRYETKNLKTSEWILVCITALSRVSAYVMAFATAFYMIFKYM